MGSMGLELNPTSLSQYLDNYEPSVFFLGHGILLHYTRDDDNNDAQLTGVLWVNHHLVLRAVHGTGWYFE